MAYSLTIPISLGTSKTGLTLAAQLYNPADGSPIGSPITTGFVERVSGRYDWNSGSVLPDNQAVGVAFLSGTDELASTVLNPTDVYDIAAIKSKLDSLNVTTAITIATPIDPATGNATVVRGDAYLASSPKGALVWTETSGAWLPYVGKPSVFTAKSADGKATISVAATVAHVSGNTCTITVELPSDATETITDKQLAAGDFSFDVQSTIAPDMDDTPLAGTLTILPDVSPPSD